ncbi:hypothetical protein CcI49_04760 [Frankia sp. CcI49]|nr:hypothetical protein CcI49_04760 [Frankia sp. CcI49]
MTDAEVDELARVFPTPTGAGHLLSSAGLGPQYHPRQAANAFEFWHAVSADIGAGRLPDGRLRVLIAAAARYPDNEVFRQALGITQASEGTARAPAWPGDDDHEAPAAAVQAGPAGATVIVHGGNVIFGGRQASVIGVQHGSPEPPPR